MKYITPKYDLTMLETEDILLVSSGKYEVEEKGDGSGNVVINASDMFI